LSLDTQRAEKAASSRQQPDKRRRSSIEVATLTASHLGSMIGRSSALSTLFSLHSVNIFYRDPDPDLALYINFYHVIFKQRR
jgi:hypothetical protein